MSHAVFLFKIALWDGCRTKTITVLPQFPEFKSLTWADKEDIEQFTRKFQPYSDFNFTSLYAWNVNDKMRISELNCNLVVLFTDYLTGTLFAAFIGSNMLSETASTLLAYSEMHFNECVLKLVPEIVAESLCPKQFIITPDRDAYDYIYSISDLSNLLSLSSNKSNGARLARLFIDRHPNHFCTCTKLNERDISEVDAVYTQWAQNKGISHLLTNEYLAFQRLIESGNKTIQALLLYVDTVLKGFLFFEIFSREYALCHFSKADVACTGIYDAMLWYVGKTLAEENLQYLNFEQDLGIEKLRRAKSKYVIHGFLKKYTVKRKPV